MLERIRSIIDGANLYIYIFKFYIYIFVLRFYYSRRATFKRPVIIF